MNAKNFVNFHVLISHSPSCLNRDDMNMQKTAVFGGKKRVRISSQSLKRAIRKSSYYKNKFEVSVRTRRLFDELCIELSNQMKSDKGRKAVEQSALYAAAIFEGKTKAKEIKEYKRANNGHIETQIIPFHEKEKNALRKILLEAAKKNEAERLGFIRAEIAGMQKEQVKGVTLDVGLSGRMANSELIYDIDGAIAIGHAITTHAVEPQDIDWFTAVDDLTQDAGETGAGHLNTQEFSAGVFYRYASLNLKQLQLNLGLLTDMESDETPETRKQTTEIAKHMFHMLATIVPTAKRQPFAADNLADFAIVSFSDLPVSLANAFERPVEQARGGGYLIPSETKLTEYWEKLNRAYELNEEAAAFCFDESPWENENDREKPSQWPKNLKPFDTLSKLEAWIVENGES